MDLIELKPSNDNLPLYSRDATIFAGDLDAVESWLQGVSWARKYDEMCSISNNKKRSRAEETVRHRVLLKLLATGKTVDNPAEELS